MARDVHYSNPTSEGCTPTRRAASPSHIGNGVRHTPASNDGKPVIRESTGEVLGVSRWLTIIDGPRAELHGYRVRESRTGRNHHVDGLNLSVVYTGRVTGRPEPCEGCRRSSRGVGETDGVAIPGHKAAWIHSLSREIPDEGVLRLHWISISCAILCGHPPKGGIVVPCTVEERPGLADLPPRIRERMKPRT